MIIIHEYGEPSHYIGATKVAELYNTRLSYYEFSTLKLIFSGVKKRNQKFILKAIRDFFLLFSFFLFPRLLKGETVIIGIAPIDYRVFFFNRILKYSHVIYHTSWTKWDGSKYPKQYSFNKKLILKWWSFFLKHRVNSFAVVTETVKQQLVDNFNIDKSKIVVVYHSYESSTFNVKTKNKNDKLKAIFVGRLVKEKGVDDLLAIAKINSEVEFIIVGEGPLSEHVKIEAREISNVNVYNFIKDKNKLADLYRESTFILLPSKRTPFWEELFGMVLIEAMACGCIPLCTDHNGPSIILGHSTLKINVFSEDEYIQSINASFKKYQNQPHLLVEDRINAIAIAQKYSKESIADFWAAVIKLAKE